MNQGVRVIGGRIYDSETGTSCHQVRCRPWLSKAQDAAGLTALLLLLQCRQKTVEAKGKCTECTLYWCSRCLSNRYGETVEAVTALADWSCPRCRGLCNCSNCRKASLQFCSPARIHVLGSDCMHSACRSRACRRRAFWPTCASARAWSPCLRCWPAAARAAQSCPSPAASPSRQCSLGPRRRQPSARRLPLSKACMLLSA